jgi:tetratricopeptide (TPR) repeat protein
MAVGLDAMRRIIREQEPPRPSTRLSTMLAADLTTVARQRQAEPARLGSLLRGDLDWIVMKALEKDRSRRYETANGLARDIERHLADEPVVARPPSAAYRFQKMARRNRLIVAAAGAVGLALILGLAASSWEYLKERQARQRGVAVIDLLQKLLGAADRDGLKGSDYTLHQLLDDFSPGLTNQFAGQPEAEATVRETMGWTYYRLGALAQSESNLRQAYALRRKALGPLDRETLQAQELLAFLIFNGLRHSEEGGKLAYENWQSRLRVFGPEDDDTLTSQELYAQVLSESGKLQEAETMQRHILAIRERVQGPDNKDTICTLGNLGQTLDNRGAWAEAERYFRETLTRFQRIGYADQQDGILCAKEIAMLRLLQGFPTDAEKLLSELRPRAVQKLGPEHFTTLHIQRVLARAYAEEGRFADAETLCKETLETRRRAKANLDSVGTGYTLLYLGRVLVQQGKFDEAEPVLQEAMTTLREEAKVKPELAAQLANWLGVIRIGRKAYAEAEVLMLSGSEQFFVVRTMMSRNERGLAVANIINLYQAWGKTAQAEVWQKKAEQLSRAQQPTGL